MPYQLSEQAKSLMRPETRDKCRARYARSAVEDRLASTNRIDSKPKKPTESSITLSTPRSMHPVYELIKPISKGLLNVVHEAYDCQLDRHVAIKELGERLRRDPRRTEQFWKQARNLAAMSHENIVSVHGVDQDRGWIVMELMSDSLQNLAKNKALDADAHRSALKQALHGISFLHRNNRIHGEIAADTFLISSEGRIKLTNSSGFDVTEEFRAPGGEVRHLAPELLLPGTFGPIGPSLDLYCLGFAFLDLMLGDKLAEFATGVRDAVDQNEAWIRWHSSPTAKLPSLAEMLPGTPDDLVVVIDRLIQKSVANRYATCDEVLRELSNKPVLLLPITDTLFANGPPANKPEERRWWTTGKETLLPNPKADSKMDSKPSGLRERIRHPIIAVPIIAFCLLAGAMVMHSDRATPRYRMVRIETTPADATVTIDKMDFSKQSPWEGELPVGEKTIRFQLADHESIERFVNVRPGEHTQIVSVRMPRYATSAVEHAQSQTAPVAENASTEDTNIDRQIEVEPDPPSPVPLDQGDAVGENMPVPDENSAPPLDESNEGDEEDSTANSTIANPSRPPVNAPSPSHSRRAPNTGYAFPVQGLSVGEQQQTVVRLIHMMLDEPWTAKQSALSSGNAHGYFGKASKISNDPRIKYAYALLLEKHNQRELAIRELRDSIDQVNQSGVPFYAPHRRRIVLQLVCKDFEGAAVNCQALIKDAIASEQLTRHQLGENVRFIGRVYGFLRGPVQPMLRRHADLERYEEYILDFLSPAMAARFRAAKDSVQDESRSLAASDNEQYEAAQRLRPSRSIEKHRQRVFRKHTPFLIDGSRAEARRKRVPNYTSENGLGGVPLLLHTDTGTRRVTDSLYVIDETSRYEETPRIYHQRNAERPRSYFRTNFEFERMQLLDSFIELDNPESPDAERADHRVAGQFAGARF